MNARKLLDEFFSSYAYHTYLELMEEPEILRSLLTNFFSLNKKNQKPMDYALDMEALANFYLNYLPVEELVLMHEAIYFHEYLLDFYHFLFIKKYISEAEFKNILHFFQENKRLYLTKMTDQSVWSQTKIDTFKLISQQDTDELAHEFQEQADMDFDNFFCKPPYSKDAKNKKSSANILSFPTRKTEEIFQFRIDLDGEQPPVWRRVLVPANYTLAQMHSIIQVLFGWHNQHLHEFHIDGMTYAPLNQKPHLPDFWEGSEDSATVTLQEVFQMVKSCKYIYDFDNDWCHILKLEQRLSPLEANQMTNEDPPFCLKAVRETPAENSRGTNQTVSFNLAQVNLVLSRI